MIQHWSICNWFAPKRSQRTNLTRKGIVSIALTLTLVFSAAAQLPKNDALAAGFANPPDSAKPRVWWHWMNGNITKEGIKLDLEWMKRVGIGGFQKFDAARNTTQMGDKA